MPSRFYWDCDLPQTAAFKVTGKPFPASGYADVPQAREQTRACIEQLNETELRSLSTGSLDRLPVLIKVLGLKLDQPPMLDLAGNLLPPGFARSLLTTAPAT